MVWDYKSKDFGELGAVADSEIKHRCPCCKKTTNFKRVDVDAMKGLVYCKGDYMLLYRCDKCWIIIGVGKWIEE